MPEAQTQSTPSKYGVLLVNLGTPSEPTSAAVRKFLREFLSDPQVVDLPRLLWLPILYGIILLFRPRRVAKNYQKIWTAQGSPLMAYSLAQQEKLQQRFSNNSKGEFKVTLAMTYGQPSILSALLELKNWGADKLVIFPLYPQFSRTTTSPVLNQLVKLDAFVDHDCQVIHDYHQHDHYLDALAKTIRPQLDQLDKLIMSFHGIPERYVSLGDPYHSQCLKTAELLAEKLDLSAAQWEVAFQSRFGKEEWVKPYFDQRMTELPQEGVKRIGVICPGFSVDCLETLEEIALENKALFLQSGGQAYHYIGALNDSDAHIDMMYQLVFDTLERGKPGDELNDEDREDE